jgi:hypothetical protein
MLGRGETMMTADSLRLSAYGPGEDETRIVEDADGRGLAAD